MAGQPVFRLCQWRGLDMDHAHPAPFLGPDEARGFELAQVLEEGGEGHVVRRVQFGGGWVSTHTAAGVALLERSVKALGEAVEAGARPFPVAHSSHWGPW